MEIEIYLNNEFKMLQFKRYIQEGLLEQELASLNKPCIYIFSDRCNNIEGYKYVSNTSVFSCIFPYKTISDDLKKKKANTFYISQELQPDDLLDVELAVRQKLNIPLPS